MKTKINLDNLRCAGCSNSVKKSLKSFPEIYSVRVDIESGSLEIVHDDDLKLEVLKEKLAGMGYPEKGSLDGFAKFKTSAKSLVSCAVGKISAKNQ